MFNKQKISRITFFYLVTLAISLSGCVSVPQVKLYVPISLEKENVSKLMAIQYPPPPKLVIKDGIPIPTINDLDGGLYAVDGTYLPETGGIVYLAPGSHEVTFGRITVTRKYSGSPDRRGEYYQRSEIGSGTSTIKGEAGKIYSWGQLYNAIPLEEKKPVLKVIEGK